MQNPDFSELDELTEENLDFSALSDGLGIHGLKSKVSPALQEAPARQAAAATPAGPASFALPASAKRAAPAKNPEPQEAAEKASWLQPAAPRALRLAAFGLDFLFVTGPLALACKLNFTTVQFLELLRSDGKIFAALYGSMLAAYFLLSESFGGQSLGKILLGLRIVEDDKYEKPVGFWTALARLPILALGLAFFGLGLFWTFNDAKSRSWHDKFTGSIVRRKA